MEIASRETREKLIATVQNYPALYDPSRHEYSDRNHQDKLWHEVAEIVGVSVLNAKRSWQNLRSCYRRAVITESGPDSKKPARHYWYLKPQMDFLFPYMKMNLMNGTMEEDYGEDNNENENDFFEIFETPTSPEAIEQAAAEGAAADSVPEKILPKRLSKPVNRYRPILPATKQPKKYPEVRSTIVRQIQHLGKVNNPTPAKANPDISFFQSMLPDIKQLNDANKRKLKMMFMNELNQLLDEQQTSEANSSTVSEES